MNLMEHASADEERVSSIARQMNRWVDQVLGQSFHCSASAWSPAINMYEASTYYYIVADLAGVNPDKIDLKVESGDLVISGQRPTPGLQDNHPGVRLLMMEIDHGSFCRSLRLPKDADVDAVSASYRGGYLWVRLPKKS